MNNGRRFIHTTKKTQAKDTLKPQDHNIKHNCCIPSRLPRSDNLPANRYSDTTRSTLKPLQQAQLLQRAQLTSLSGGWFYMGTDNALYPQDGEAPRRRVFISPFAIAATTVTNAEFAHFVSATGYQTSAEILGRSFVFKPGANSKSALSGSNPVAYAPWWQDTEAACWHAPQGHGSTIAEIPDHPVTHVSYTDALHYCDWSNTRLPTEAQWEYAARGGLTDYDFPWGDTLEPNGQHRCNIWQGQFPTNNTASDSYALTAPVNAYPPNAFGLYNMTGNVWEWVADRFTTNHSPRPVKNPAGPLNGKYYVTRGGSFLCHHSYCARYHVFSRQSLTADTSCANIGFRVAAC